MIPSQGPHSLICEFGSNVGNTDETLLSIIHQIQPKQKRWAKLRDKSIDEMSSQDFANVQLEIKSLKSPKYFYRETEVFEYIMDLIGEGRL